MENTSSKSELGQSAISLKGSYFQNMLPTEIKWITDTLLYFTISKVSEPKKHFKSNTTEVNEGQLL